MKTFPFHAVVTCVACLHVAAPIRAASILYSDPAGGWLYAYEGDALNYGTGGGVADSLDGTWVRGGGSDSWDGSGLGGVFNDATNDPGGIEAVTEGGTTYIRMQDTGDLSAQGAVLGYTPTDPRNGKIYLYHPLALPADAMDTGITIAFRVRISTTGLLDGQYPGGFNVSENFPVPGGTPWPAGGNGYFNHSGGKGLIGFHQGNTGMISFSPAVPSDQRNDQSSFGQNGLMTNNLNGDVVSGLVDPYNLEPGIENVFAVNDWAEWHEYWINISADNSGGGTHRVRLYADGSLTPVIFDVTAGDGHEGGSSSATTYLGLGLGSTSQMGAVDVDYIAVKDGVIDPVPEPAAGSAILVGAALFAGMGRVRARFVG